MLSFRSGVKPAPRKLPQRSKRRSGRFSRLPKGLRTEHKDVKRISAVRSGSCRAARLSDERNASCVAEKRRGGQVAVSSHETQRLGNGTGRAETLFYEEAG